MRAERMPGGGPLLLLLVLGACGGEGERPARQRTLVVAYGADEFTLTSNRERLGRYPLNAGMCETLVRLADDFTVAPALATRWEEGEHDAVRLVLRRGVTFSDGTPLGGDAVRQTLAHAVATRTEYSFLADSSVRMVDDSTVEVRPVRENRRLVEQLVHPTYGIFDPRSDPARLPVCTGPFRLGSYVPHQRLTVVRNERYRGPPAAVDTLVFRFMPDETTRTLALRSGEVDIIADVGRPNARALAREAGWRVVAAPTGAVVVMYMNLNGAPPYHQLRDSRLRRAIAMAIDRRMLVENVLGGGGHATVVATVNPPAVLGSHARRVRGVPHDPGAARESLGGRHRVLSLIYNPASIDRAMVEYVQGQLAGVGIDVRVEQLDAAAFESRLNSGAFDLDLELPNQNDANPSFLLALRWYSKSSTRSAAFTHASPRFDALVERALRAATVEESRRAAADAMHQLVDVEVGAVPLAGISRLYALRDRVRGFVPHPSRLNQEWHAVGLVP